MRAREKVKAWLKGEPKIPKPVKQPATFFLAMQKYENATGYSVRYKHRKIQGEMPINVQDIPVFDTMPVAKTIENFIGVKWG